MHYSEWNEAIGKWFFLPENADERVFLNVDDSELHALSRPFQHFDSAEESAKDFLSAVLGELRKRGWDWVGITPHHFPGFLGLLAFQVYVVFRMEHEGELTANAYWPRMRKLLGLKEGALPLGLTYPVHQELWHNLQKWTNEAKYKNGALGRIQLPQDQTGNRHVKLPYSQALLRTEDLRKLPLAFERSNLKPGEDLPGNFLWKKIEDNLSEPGLWTPHALRVLLDENRREAALEQMAEALQRWDRSREDAPARNPGCRHRLWANFKLRPRGRIFGGLAQRDGDMSWQTVEGTSLEEILLGHGKTGYRPFHDGFYLLVQDPLFGYVEASALLPGQVCLLISRAPRLRGFETSRAAVSDDWKILQSLSGCPPGWSVVHFTVKDVLGYLPAPWADLVAGNLVGMSLVGGVRLNRKTWMAGLGPRLRLSGRSLPSRICVDSEQVQVTSDLLQLEQLDRPGIHQVWIPGEKRRRLTVRVEEPRVAREVLPPAWPLASGSWPGELVLPVPPTALVGVTVTGEFTTPITLPERRLTVSAVLYRLLMAERHHRFDLVDLQGEDIEGAIFAPHGADNGYASTL